MKMDSSGSKFYKIVEAISRTMNLPASFWILSDDRKNLVIDAAIGYPAKFIVEAFLPLDEITFTGEAFKTGNIQTARNLSNDSRWKFKSHANEMGWKAAIAVPVIVGEVVFGVLTILAFIERDFSDLEKQLLQDYAVQIEQAIEYEKVQSTLGSLLETSRKFSELITERPLNILTEIAERACKVTGADCTVVYPYDQNRKEFYEIENVASYGLKHNLELTEKPRRVKGMAAYITREGEVVLENIKMEDPQMLESSPFIQRENVMAFMGISLTVPGQILGVLYVNYRDIHTFGHEEKNIIRLFAHLAALSIHNARLYQQATLRANALKTLHNITPDLISVSSKPEDLNTVLCRITENAQSILGAQLIDLYQYYQNTDQFTLPPIQLGDRFVPEVIKNNILEDDILYQIIKLKEPKYTINALEDEILTQKYTVNRGDKPADRFVVREQVHASAAIPLQVGDERVGVMFANFRTPQFFPEQQQELIELFASQAAIAIHNSRLYHEIWLKSERLELIKDVAAEISSSTNITQILQFAVNGLARVFNVKQTAVALFDDTGEFAEGKVEFLGQGCISALGHRIPLKNNPQIDWILERKKPLVVYDVQNDPIMEQTKEIMAIRHTLSLMIIPIVIDDVVVGTIGVDAIEQKRHFTEEEAQLAKAIADQAAAALRIAQQLDDRLKDIHALQEITEQMHQGDQGALLDLIAERSVALTGAKHGGVWLISKDKSALEFRGLAHKEQYKEAPPNIPLNDENDNSFSKWVVLNKCPYLSGDVRKDENYKPWYSGTISELTVPIIYQSRVIGSINVESEQPNKFNQDHLRLLFAMAGQAAIVVQNARFLAQLKILDDIGIELTAGIRMKEAGILELIYKQAQRLTGARDMYIALYNENNGVIRFGLATEHGSRVNYKPRKANMEERGKTEEIIFTGKPILHKTLEEATTWYKQPGHAEFVGIVQPSWLGVPMLVGERVLGVIAIYDLQYEYAYDELDLQVFSSMASQVAIALDNANLYYDVNQKLERRVNALAALNKIGNTLTSGIRLRENEVIDLIFTQAQRLTNAQDLYIALYDENNGDIQFRLATEKGKPVQYQTRKANMEKRGKTEEILFTRQPILHQTLDEAHEWYSQFEHAEFVGKISPSWLGVPMMVGEKVLGVIAAVDLEKEYAYDELHLEVLSSMANQAAIALDNANLFYDVNKKLEEANVELRQAQERAIFASLGEVAAGLIHKMGNTIGHIPALVNRIEKVISPTEIDAIRKLTQIKEGVSDALEYIGSMGKLLELKEITKANADLTLLMSDAIRQTKEVLDQNKIILEEHYPALPTINVNSPLIIEVFRNLIHNAAEAMPSGGDLKIIGTVENDKIAIRIVDTGCGIVEDKKNNLFKLGFSTKKEGKGIGLWFSKTVIEEHKGTISVESETGKGTTFLISLPIGATETEFPK